jgi:hypothetical protein
MDYRPLFIFGFFKIKLLSYNILNKQSNNFTFNKDYNKLDKHHIKYTFKKEFIKYNNVLSNKY